jgi:hypothetical protein
MHVIIAVLFVLIAGSTSDTARADPYRWCAVYAGGDLGGGGSNCYFLTLEQCRAAISGMGGFCEPNQFYDGQPVRTPEDPPSSRRRSPSRR